MASTSTSKLLYFDFTFFTTEKDKTSDLKLVLNWCKEACSEYGFQLENPPSGKLHFQGRVKVINKRRLTSLYGKKNPLTAQCHWSVTSNGAIGGSTKNVFHYVTKIETRVDGPWTHMDAEGPVLFDDVTVDIKDIVLRPFQQKLVDMSKVYNKRQIDVIYDPKGNCGKSVITSYLYVHHGAIPLPAFNDFKDLLQAASSMCYRGKSKEHVPCFIFDFPRAMNKEKLSSLYSAIEQIKNGMMIDTRYKCRVTKINPPRIFIFTNTMVDFNLLSGDMWKVWTIKDNDLVPYDATEPSPDDSPYSIIKSKVFDLLKNKDLVKSDIYYLIKDLNKYLISMDNEDSSSSSSEDED